MGLMAEGRMIIVLVMVSFGDSANSFKCCSEGLLLDDDFNCTSHVTDMPSMSMLDNRTGEALQECPDGINDQRDTNITDTNLACTYSLLNGTVVTLSCDKITSNHTYGSCDSSFKILNFWGASMMVFATIVYTLPYILVVIVYCSYKDLRKRAFDKSLICYNSSYAILNVILIIIGFFELCHKTLPAYVYGVLGTIVLYFVQAACLWMFVLCYDMTLVITRFRWASSDSKARAEKRKFKVYSISCWGISIAPAIITAITEFSPAVPMDSPIRANFSNFHRPASEALLIYTLTIPVLTCLINTMLFIYTTYKMVKVKKDSEILNENNARSAKKEYFVYLKMYIIMDAPWLTGALSAIFPSLWILKFARVMQPILMLYIILPKKRILRTIGWMKKKEEHGNNRGCHMRKPLNGNAAC